MKKLNDIVREHLYSASKKYMLPALDEGRTIDEFIDINNLKDADDEQVSFYYRWNTEQLIGRYYDVNENLTSYRACELIAKINREFGDSDGFKYVGQDSDNKTDNGIVCLIWKGDDLVSSVERLELRGDKSTLLKHILSSYGYYLTYISYDKQYDLYKLYLEAKTTKNVFTNLRKNKYVYHVTNASNLENIKKKGLLIRGGKSEYAGGYRYFPERLFLIGGTNNECAEGIRNVLIDKHLRNNYIICRIDLSRLNVNIYCDEASGDSTHYYTYENIPSRVIDIFSSIEEL